MTVSLRTVRTADVLEVIARDDGTGEDVGSAWCELGRGQVHASWVEVEPGARGRGVGAELLKRLIAEASALGIGYLVMLHDDGPVARHMERASGAITSRRVVAGQVKDVIVVPSAA